MSANPKPVPRNKAGRRHPQMNTRETILERREVLPNGCIRWTGSTNPLGYGHVSFHNRNWLAHRLIYTWLVSPIPDGMDIDHLCRYPSCVNPAHMEVVTRRENSRRGFGACAMHARKTHCKNGHPYDEQNTYVRPDGTGKQCRACCRERYLRRRGYGQSGP
jgi:hypothetical protein